MTIGSALEQTTIPRLDTELLLAHILKKDRSYIKAHSEQNLTFWQLLRFFYLIKKRKHQVPLAYLTGSKEFYGFSFRVNKHTLVPRPETEQMVELAVSYIKDKKSKNVVLIDVGTGSGCIPISIIKTSAHTSTEAYASDISKEALRVAKKNAQTHGVDITYKQGSLLEPWMQELKTTSSQIVITANLPYITEEQWSQEASIKHEPKSALVADEQGLALYRELLEQVQSLNLKVPVFLLLEIDPDQTELIGPLVSETLPSSAIELHHDLCGLTRIVTIRN